MRTYEFQLIPNVNAYTRRGDINTSRATIVETRSPLSSEDKYLETPCVGVSRNAADFAIINLIKHIFYIYTIYFYLCIAMYLFSSTAFQSDRFSDALNQRNLSFKSSIVSYMPMRTPKRNPGKKESGRARARASISKADARERVASVAARRRGAAQDVHKTRRGEVGQKAAAICQSKITKARNASHTGADKCASAGRDKRC